MSRVKFGVYKTPKGNGKEQQSCARVITYGTRRMDKICKFISECSSVNSSDIKGVIEALVVYMGRELEDGYSVELEGLGYFSPSLRSVRSVDKKGRTVTSASIGGVNFRCSNRMKELVKTDCPQMVKRENIPSENREGRKTKMLVYLQENPFINISGYAELNHCTRYCASQDIKLFEANGIINGTGSNTHRVYVLHEETNNNE